MMLRILVADKLADQGLALLQRTEDVQADVKTGLSEDQLAEIIGPYDGMIIRSGVKVTGKVLARAGKLRAIARAGVGVDNVDLPAATQAGILVMNTPDANTLSTAEHTIGLLMSLARKIVVGDAHVRGGQWKRSEFVGSQLAGQTIGIIGLGRVGKAVAARALGLEMKVLSFDPFYSGETALEGRVKMVRQLHDLLPDSDVVTLHTPITPDTRGLIGRRELGLMKNSALLINCARGGLVDETALVGALTSGQIAGAALDVYESEPPKDSPLLKLPNVVLTPHLGASTRQAQLAVSVDAVQAMLDYLQRDEIRSAVNVTGLPVELSQRDREYCDLAKRMGAVLSPLCGEGIQSIAVTTRGEGLQHIRSIVSRCLLIELLAPHFDFGLNVINVELFANQRGIQLRQVTTSSSEGFTENIEVQVASPDGAHRIEGTVFVDGRPRILAIDDYRMDMVPEGDMVVLFNDDQPGVIGLVGTTFGNHRVNIADLTLSRQANTALMVFKIDGQAPPEAIEELRHHRPPIRLVRTVTLPPLTNPS